MQLDLKSAIAHRQVRNKDVQYPQGNGDISDGASTPPLPRRGLRFDRRI